MDNLQGKTRKLKKAIGEGEFKGEIEISAGD